MKPKPVPEVLVFGDPATLDIWPAAPAWAWNYAALLCQAEESLARREQAYPEWIRSGRIASDAAEADIAAWRLIVAEWRWIVRGDGALPPPHTLAARRTAIELSLERVEAEARRRRSPELIDQQERLGALLWHLQRTEHGAPKVHRLARLSRLLRADAAPQKAAAA